MMTTVDIDRDTTARRRARVHELTNRGESTTHIAKLLGITERTVQRLRKKPIEEDSPIETVDWSIRACRGYDPDIWFPKKTEGAKRRFAKGICLTCPIIDECLQHAIANDIRDGIWGGTTKTERAVMTGKRS